MATKHIALALAWGMALSAGCAGRKAVWKDKDQPSTSGQTTQVAGDQVESLIAEGDAKWEQRTDPANIRAAIAAWEKAAEADASNAELLVKLTRANYFLADGFLRQDDKEYLRVMDLGVKWGERAMVASSSEFEAKMRGGTKYPEAVKVMPKEGVPAMYWYASSLGKWAKKKGFAVLLGQKDNVKATMDRALELDPEFFYGGPHRYFGAYYAIAPGFAGGDLEKSQVHFKKSLEISPEYIGTKVLWAENLSTKQQDEDTFDRLLNEVLAAPDDAIPELGPEIMVEKQKAKELLAQKNDLF
jgi:tetratricopeptide (TPR) repeat protein